MLTAHTIYCIIRIELVNMYTKIKCSKLIPHFIKPLNHDNILNALKIF